MVNKKENKENKEETKIGKSLSDFFSKTETKDKESELFRLINQFINSEKNIELKTRIKNPIAWSAYSVVSDLVEKLGFSLGKELMDRFIAYYFKYEISHDGLSRDEFVKAIKGGSLSLDNENNKEIIGVEKI